jgi:hypothetical protein
MIAKKASILLLLIFSISNLFSQEDFTNIIAPAGGTLGTNNMNIDYTLGNWTVLNMDNSNGQIGNGLFNERYVLVHVRNEIANEIKVELYPNPASEWLTLSVVDTKELPKGIRIVSTNGSVVFQTDWPVANNQIRIDLDMLESELYYLNIYNEQQSILKTLKFVKIK